MSTLDELCASLNATETSAALLNLLSDAVGILVVTMEQDDPTSDGIPPWTILWASRQADSMFGFLAGELQGKTLETLIPERYRQIHVKHTQGFSEEPSIKVMGATGDELFGRQRSGAEISLQLALYPSMYQSGMKRMRVSVVTLIRSRPGSGGGRCPVAHA